ncbi:MAG: hypothetical protein M1817_006575 [Caeruleum heppii]|nr:MAG: hypothetical protein M1817_006575 [Caeruleum heppii]
MLHHRDASSYAYQFRTQWQNPSDVLSILLIIGGEVVQKALAQMSGSSFVVVSFSFGWVAYAFSSIIALVGDGRLMPAPDYPCKIINTDTTSVRENRSWILGRLLRDHERILTDQALSVEVYEASEAPHGGLRPGQPTPGTSSMIGLVVVAVQLGISAIPLGLHRDWGIFLITLVGTILALITGALPQWKAETYACREKSDKNIAITSGNGSRHIMLILGRGRGLDLEDMAAAEGPRMRRPWEKHGWFTSLVLTDPKPSNRSQASDASLRRETVMLGTLPADFWMTRTVYLILSLFWIALLVSVAGLKQNSWYLLAVGAIGMAQNALLAGVSRRPEDRGIHLTRVEGIARKWVLDVLMDVEVSYPPAGRTLIHEYFPNGFTPGSAEDAWWSGNRKEYDDLRWREREERGWPRSLKPDAGGPADDIVP